MFTIACGESDGGDGDAGDASASASASGEETGTDTNTQASTSSDASSGEESESTTSSQDSGMSSGEAETAEAEAESGTTGDNVLFESDAELMDFSNVNNVWTLDMCAKATGWAMSENCVIVSGSRVMHFQVDGGATVGQVTFELDRFTPTSTTAGMLVEEDELGNPISLQLVDVPLDTPFMIEGTGEVASVEATFSSEPAITLTDILVLAP